MSRKIFHKIRELPLEVLHSITHGLGILFGIIWVPVLIYIATKTNSVAGFWGTFIYGFCFLMVFIFSTLYHGSNDARNKERLKILDHISIYFLISGTYTPLIIIFVNNSFGYLLMIILWSLTLTGIIFKVFYTGKFEIFSTLIYLVMGWMLFAGGNKFFIHMPPSIISLIIVGGVLYTVGAVFFLWQRYKYHHAVWHLFVLAAAICHYAAIFLAVQSVAA